MSGIKDETNGASRHVPSESPSPVKKRKLAEEEPVLVPTSKLLIKRLSERARLPTKGSALSAGYDLYRYVI